jgi:hypothetical protein
MRASLGIAALVSAGVIMAAAAGTPLERVVSTPVQPSAAPEATTRIVVAATTFLTTLDEAGRSRVQYPFDSPQQAAWSNLPVGMVARGGLRLGDLTKPQRNAANALLATALSTAGYQKVVAIMGGDEVLRKQSGSGAPRFGEDEYYLAFIGAPSTTSPWMLQFGGHHLAINLTLAGRRSTLAPTLTAAQPATYTLEGRTIRPLGAEHDKAFQLMASLDATQRSQAILNYRVSDLVLGAGRDGRTIQPEGLKVSALSTPQQTLLLEIVREWAGIANEALAGPRMEEIRAKLSETWFAWSGDTVPGSAAYFRIQGPTLVIEYAPQRGVDHIHTIYRDPTNDYGASDVRQ